MNKPDEDFDDEDEYEDDQGYDGMAEGDRGKDDRTNNGVGHPKGNSYNCRMYIRPHAGRYHVMPACKNLTDSLPFTRASCGPSRL